jgi:hypothetical protein
MKKVTTTIIALVTMVSSILANNTNPNTNSTSVLAASVNNSNVALNFTSLNNSRFEIERSFYSNNFTVIAAGENVMAGNSNFMINDNPAELAGREIAYYRVKTIAANGTVSYSNTTVVNLETAATAATVKNTSISFTAAQNGNATIEIKSISGKTVTVKNTIASRGNNTVELTNGLAKGIYTATISVNGVAVDTQKVIAE